MDPQRALDFIRDHHRGVLVTTRADGRPQTSPVVAAVDDHDRVAISTREPAMKVKNLERDPRATYCAMPDEFFGEWVQVDGMATIIRLPEAMDALVGLYRSISGEHPDWDDYRQAMERDRRVIIAIEVERAGPDRAG
jgi:PPOX class probable F420-dependent enzyme